MPTSKARSITIACFGETLWDILPRGIFLGGAPVNVAYHLSRLGLRALPVSTVGNDFLGNEALRRIAGWGVEATFIARRRRRPTGTVRATLDNRGVAKYKIVERVAWDRIQAPRSLLQMRPPVAIVYGSLALRSTANRRTLIRLLAAWPATLRVLDLNLRPPFDEGIGVQVALRHAQFIKLNDEELARMTGRPGRTLAQLESGARHFANVHQCARICVTAGERGAGLLWSGQWWWEEAQPIAVRDTIGAGDAFLAGFLAAHLGRSESPRNALARACRHGEFVAAHDGATPPYAMDARGQPVDFIGRH
jgi:fructokinase